MNTTPTNRKSKQELRTEAAAKQNVGIVLILLLVAIGGTGTYDPKSAISFGEVVSSLAAFAAVLGLVAIDIINYRKADEFQQIVRLKAAAISFALVIAAAFASEVLVNLNVGNPRQYLQIIFIGGVLSWVIIPWILVAKTRR